MDSNESSLPVFSYGKSMGRNHHLSSHPIGPHPNDSPSPDPATLGLTTTYKFWEQGTTQLIATLSSHGFVHTN